MEHKSSITATHCRNVLRVPRAELAVFALACRLCVAPAAHAGLEEAASSLEPPIDELREQIGKDAEVTFTVIAVGGRSNLYLNSRQDWRSPDCFTAMVVPEARDEIKKLGFDAPFDGLAGKKVRCRGELELNRGQVRIVVRDVAKQFEIVKPEGSTEKSGTESAEDAREAPTAGSPDAQPLMPPSPQEPYISPTIEALRESVGKERDVTFRVMNAGGRSHFYLNSQSDYRLPDCFTAQVDPEAVKDLASLGLTDARTEIIGKLLECRGKVELNEGRLRIVVADVKKQLRIVEEPMQQADEGPKPVEESEAAP